MPSTALPAPFLPTRHLPQRAPPFSRLGERRGGTGGDSKREKKSGPFLSRTGDEPRSSESERRARAGGGERAGTRPGALRAERSGAAGEAGSAGKGAAGTGGAGAAGLCGAILGSVAPLPSTFSSPSPGRALRRSALRLPGPRRVRRTPEERGGPGSAGSFYPAPVAIPRTWAGVPRAEQPSPGPGLLPCVSQFTQA